MGSVGHEDLLVEEWFLGSSTPHREVFTRLRPQIISSHDLDQRLWASQLVQLRSRRPDVVFGQKGAARTPSIYVLTDSRSREIWRRASVAMLRGTPRSRARTS